MITGYIYFGSHTQTLSFSCVALVVFEVIFTFYFYLLKKF